ncbi:unnamed protein product [Protopolystoma xenopodis]|uniref:Uncharacterized protein n=1 Tax=Protopolystoma xenopodis TaxID=117903 RepID=A0A3S4ZLZ2_9PLAT|nr:unnamed protein product [Protopolystoma xenopodis]
MRFSHWPTAFLQLQADFGISPPLFQPRVPPPSSRRNPEESPCFQETEEHRKSVRTLLGPTPMEKQLISTHKNVDLHTNPSCDPSSSTPLRNSGNLLSRILTRHKRRQLRFLLSQLLQAALISWTHASPIAKISGFNCSVTAIGRSEIPGGKCLVGNKQVNSDSLFCLDWACLVSILLLDGNTLIQTLARAALIPVLSTAELHTAAAIVDNQASIGQMNVTCSSTLSSVISTDTLHLEATDRGIAAANDALAAQENSGINYSNHAPLPSDCGHSELPKENKDGSHTFTTDGQTTLPGALLCRLLSGLNDLALWSADNCLGYHAFFCAMKPHLE